MAQAALFLQGAGAVNSAMGAYQGAKLNKLQLYTDADMSDINAQMAELSANQELQAGQKRKQSSQLSTAQLKSSQKAAIAANGIDLNSGSATNLLTSTDVMGEIDANTIESNAIKSAWGYKTQTVNYKNRANMARVQAKGINPGDEAFTSLLGGASKVAGSWYDYKQAGAI